MVALKAGEVEGFLRRGKFQQQVFLVYGPDAGLVGERARALLQLSVDDPDDPFQLVKLDGEVVASDPARLADEAGTLGLFGGRRAIWVRPTGRSIAPAVENTLAAPSLAATVVIEAGDLAKSSPLRVLTERSPRAVALPCFADDDKAIATLIDERLRGAGIQADRATRALLATHLGGDRLASRAELEKLLLFVHGRSEMTEADIDDVLSDVSVIALDTVVDAAYRGDSAEADEAARRLLAEGVHASVVLGAMLRQAFTLVPLCAEVEAGASADTVINAWRGLHFRRKPSALAALRLWRPAGLLTVIRRLDEATLSSRRRADLAGVLTARAVMQIALQARRKA